MPFQLTKTTAYIQLILTLDNLYFINSWKITSGKLTTLSETKDQNHSQTKKMINDEKNNDKLSYQTTHSKFITVTGEDTA